MSTNKLAGETDWVDPDDAPELDEGFFDRADWHIGERLIRRGTGPGLHATMAEAVLASIDRDALARLQATGPEWPERLNAAVTEWLQRNGA